MLSRRFVAFYTGSKNIRIDTSQQILSAMNAVLENKRVTKSCFSISNKLRKTTNGSVQLTTIFFAINYMKSDNLVSIEFL